MAALVDPRIDPPEIDADESGPLIAQGLHRTIEVWTESEFRGLHALWNLAQLRRAGGNRNTARPDSVGSSPPRLTHRERTAR